MVYSSRSRFIFKKKNKQRIITIRNIQIMKR